LTALSEPTRALVDPSPAALPLPAAGGLSPPGEIGELMDARLRNWSCGDDAVKEVMASRNMHCRGADAAEVLSDKAVTKGRGESAQPSPCWW
jgi:hypothetical protein